MAHMADQSSDDAKWLRGKMLIATPSISAPRFDRSVIFMCAHNEEHAMGIIVNKPLGELRLPHLLDQLSIESSEAAPNQAVLDGGPVERDRGFVLHSADYHSENATLDVIASIGLTATRDVLEAMGSPSGPSRSTLALGYAGWGPGQLESEIQANTWLICDPHDELVFDDSHEAKWERALASIGVAPEKLSSLFGQA
ncbi:MAG: YqgE/AlgH family protein [Caulobacterales bacterium]|nr:YqgE/AlgH family protein [Caulobacterales bacterium]